MKKLDINRHWNQIISIMNEGLVLVATDGTILMVNQAFEKMTGYRSSEIVGKPCTTLNCDACELILMADGKHWCELYSKGRDKSARCNLVTKKGNLLPIIKKASVFKDENGEQLGAVETLTDISELVHLDHEIHQLSRQLENRGGFFGIIGQSVAMQRVYELILKAAESPSPIIIFGESGTGKELVARAIHMAGPRKNKPFVQLNCSAFNESLIESELFGHTKGAFTGAYQHRMGRFEEARDGDIFLDEIGDVALSVQKKLLRVLESKKIERVGGNRPIDVDARIITATNRDLYQLIVEKAFREDFFFRISVIPIHLPPLRERVEDIPLLVNHFISLLGEQSRKTIKGLTSEAMQAFFRYSWPGNVRELKSALEYAFTIAETDLIGLEHIPPRLSPSNRLPRVFSSEVAVPQKTNAGRTALINALKQTGGNQSKAARLLGVSRVTVWSRMKKYGINPKQRF